MTNNSSNAGQGFGIAGFVLGIIALIISFIPCLGMYALVPGVVAIALSAVGLSQATKANASKGLIIAALVISILGTVIAGWQFVVIKTAADQIENGIEGWSEELKDAIDELDEDGTLESLEDALDDLEDAVEDISEEAQDAIEEAREEIQEEIDQLEDGEE